MTRNDKIIKQHAAGSTIKELAAEFELSTTRIWRILKAAEQQEVEDKTAPRARGQTNKPTAFDRAVAEAWHRSAEHLAETRPDRLRRKAEALKQA